LATACTTPWPIFAGAPAEVRDFADKNEDEFDIRERVGNAIEMAIVGSAKRFIKSSACQKVIGACTIFGSASLFVVNLMSLQMLFIGDTLFTKPVPITQFSLM
jgi:hypothetical protein